MKTDRELLELAAKAAGYVVVQPIYKGDALEFAGLELDGPVYVLWNPLTDDGDALRLAVKLEIDMTRTQVGTEMVETTIARNQAGFEACEVEGEDPYAATRRAIVRAAAAMGETL